MWRRCPYGIITYMRRRLDSECFKSNPTVTTTQPPQVSVLSALSVRDSLIALHE